MDAPAPGRRIYAALHLLDRQILDADGAMAGKLDDLEFEQPEDGNPYAAAILSGLGALGPRLGGRLGRWLAGAHRRLRPEPEPGPARIPFGVVKKINNHVELTLHREQLDNNELEAWTRDTLIAHIPGAGHAPE
jgi:hypothetical protein